MVKKGKWLAVALAGAMALSLTACGGSSSGGSSDSGSSSGSSSSTSGSAASSTDTAAASDTGDKVFVYGTDANSTTFDPASDLQTNSGSFLLHAVGEPLWRINNDGSLEYVLATSAEYNADKTQLTIQLRDGVTFSNGDPLTADDVIYTLQHTVEQPRTASMYSCVDIDNTTASGDSTVIVAMNNYDAGFLSYLGNANNMVLDKAVCEADPDFSSIVGTGPYVLDKWNESESYILKRNENYWGDAPYYDELDCIFYSEESTRYADFQAGNLDACYLTEATYINNLSNGSIAGANLVQVPSQDVYGFELASSEDTTGAFADINLRKAFAHCLDVKSMVEGMGEGVYEVSTGLVGQDNWAYTELDPYDYDPDAAAEYLKEAGYSTDNPVTIKVYAESTSWNSAMFEAAQDYCSKIGINLDLSGLADFSTILPNLLNGDQDLTFGTPSNGSGTDPSCLLQQFGPLSDNICCRVTDTELVDLWNDALGTDDQAERTTYYQQFMQGLYDNYLFIPVCTAMKSYGVQDTHTSFESAIDSSNTLDPTKLTD